MFPACLFPTCRSRSLRINHPQWFPELSSDSTDVEIAKVLYMHGNKNCPRVCAPARKPTKKTAAHMGLSQKGWNVPWGTSEIWLIKSRFKGKVIHFRLLFCVWDFPIFGGWGDTRNVPWKRPNDLFVKQVWLTKRKGILCLGCRLQAAEILWKTTKNCRISMLWSEWICKCLPKKVCFAILSLWV